MHCIEADFQGLSHALTQDVEIESIYMVNQTTVDSIANYVQITGQGIRALVRDIYALVERCQYDDDRPTIKSVCRALAIRAGVPADDETTLRRFYDAVRCCHSYHVNGRRHSGRSGKVTVIKTPEGLFYDTVKWFEHETSLDLLLRAKEALETRLQELTTMN